jgi:twitching motility protein PilT
MTLIAVMSQQLLPRAQGSGRVMGLEVMIPNSAIRNLIREDKLHQVYSQMQVGQSGSGMQTMNQALAALYLRQAITIEEAFNASSDQDELKLLISPPGQRRA